jgi:hypothetical protein
MDQKFNCFKPRKLGYALSVVHVGFGAKGVDLREAFLGALRFLQTASFHHSSLLIRLPKGLVHVPTKCCSKVHPRNGHEGPEAE